MLNSIIRNLGRITLFFNTKGQIIEQLCAEFEDEDEYTNIETKPFMTTNFTQMNLLTTNHSNYEPKNSNSSQNHSKVNLADSKTKINNVNSKIKSSKITFEIKEKDDHNDRSLDLRNSNNLEDDTLSDEVYYSQFKDKQLSRRVPEANAMDESTPRIGGSNLQPDHPNNKNIPSRNVDPTANMETLTKSTVPRIRDGAKSNMFHKQMNILKENIKSEVYTELRTMVDVAVIEHASMINVTQIQKMPENKSEAMKEEVNEIKAMIASVRTQCDGAEKKFTD